jgi:hypothetical protein
MSAMLQTAYASASETPLSTYRIVNPNLTGGARLFVNSKSDLTATLEDSTQVTFEKAGVAEILPKKGVDGRQDLTIQLSNISREAWNDIKKIVAANRAAVLAGTAPTKTTIEFRTFLPSDLTAPSGPIYILSVSKTVVNISSLSITATFTPIGDMAFPRLRYYSEKFAGVKYG